MPEFMPQTEAVIQMFGKAQPHERSVIGEMHLHYEGEIRSMVHQGHEPHNIAHSLNLEIDRSVAHTLKTKNGRKVTCKRGCGHCCKLHVSITEEEAALLQAAVEHARIELDWDKLRRQAQHSLKTWGEQPAGDRRCVFLSERNDCRVYEHRPAACRKYLVASDPQLCNTAKYPGGQVAVVVPLEGEVIASAMLAALEWGSLPKMLLKAKEAMS